jgi:hypothetical protein
MRLNGMFTWLSQKIRKGGLSLLIKKFLMMR